MELMEGNDTILVAPLKSLEDGDIKASTKREKEKEKWIKSSKWEREKREREGKNKLNHIIEFYRLKNVILLPHDLIKSFDLIRKLFKSPSKLSQGRKASNDAPLILL